ncbi:MAG: GatB/YqeY domain-containing protein [bacterium]
MPGIAEQITEKLKAAMKRKDETALNTMRALKTALRYKEVEVQRALEEGEVLQVLQKEARKRQEAAEEYRKVGKDEPAEKEEREMKLINEFLPAMLTEEEIEKRAREVIAATGAAASSDIGKVMKVLMMELKGKADGKLVNQVVTRLLSSA